jgi:hypothetical protein
MDLPQQDTTSDDDQTLEKNPNDSYRTAIRQILAQIACRCHCRRFTWQQRNHDDDSVNCNHPTMDIAPTFLKGWLTLQWQCDDESIQALLLDRDGMEHRFCVRFSRDRFTV